MTSIIILLVSTLVGALNTYIIWNAFINKKAFTKIIDQQKPALTQTISNSLFEKFNKDIHEIIPQKNIPNITELVSPTIDVFLKDKLPAKMPMIAMFIGEKTTNQLKPIFIEEIEQMYPQILNKTLQTLTTKDQISTLVMQQSAQINWDKVWYCITEKMHNIKNKAILLGAVSGFVVGTICLAINNLCA